MNWRRILPLFGGAAALGLLAYLVETAGDFKVYNPAGEWPRGEHWHVIGGLGDFSQTKFVEVDPAAAKNRSTYDDAVKTLCAFGRYKYFCFLAFFLPGDNVPPNEPQSKFFEDGGWKNYSPAVFWFNNGYTIWDCRRAGTSGAPPGAGCQRAADKAG